MFGSKWFNPDLQFGSIVYALDQMAQFSDNIIRIIVRYRKIGEII